MNIKIIDTAGLSCPQPVILVNKAIKENNYPFEIIIDSEVAKENVIRLLNKFNLKFNITEKDEFVTFKVMK